MRTILEFEDSGHQDLGGFVAIYETGTRDRRGAGAEAVAQYLESAAEEPQMA